MGHKWKISRTGIFVGAVLLVATLLPVMMACTAWGEHTDKLWLHRCNSIEKLKEQLANYPNVEVDVCFLADTFDVTHDLDTTFHLGLSPYFAYLQKHPDRRVWLDLKNLTEANRSAVCAVLDSLAQRYGVAKRQLIVESSSWWCLGQLRQAGYYTSYYVPYPAPHRLSRRDLRRFIHEMRKIADSGCVSALSFPGTWYRTLKRRLHRPIDFLTWEHRTTQFELLLRPKGRRMICDPQLKVILVKSKGDFHR